MHFFSTACSLTVLSESKLIFLQTSFAGVVNETKRLFLLPCDHFGTDRFTCAQDIDTLESVLPLLFKQFEETLISIGLHHASSNYSQTDAPCPWACQVSLPKTPLPVIVDPHIAKCLTCWLFCVIAGRLPEAPLSVCKTINTISKFCNLTYASKIKQWKCFFGKSV